MKDKILEILESCDLNCAGCRDEAANRIMELINEENKNEKQ
jgi:hypothetical protein